MGEARIKPLGFGGRILLLPFSYLLWNLKAKPVLTKSESTSVFLHQAQIHKPLGSVARLWLWLWIHSDRMRSAKSISARLLLLFYKPPPRSRNFLSLPNSPINGVRRMTIHFFWCPRDGCGCTGAGFRLMTPDNAYSFGKNEAKVGQPSKRDAFSTSSFGTVREESRKKLEYTNVVLVLHPFARPLLSAGSCLPVSRSYP